MQITRPKSNNECTDIALANTQSQSLLVKMQEQFISQEQRFLDASHRFALSIRQDADEREARLQQQIDRQQMENQTMQAYVHQVNTQIAMCQNEAASLHQRLEQWQQWGESQEARIASLTDTLKTTNEALHGVQNELTVANQAIELGRLNERFQEMERDYNGHRRQYLEAFQAHDAIIRKKLTAHVLLASAGAAVAGPVGFYTLGGVGMVNLARSNPDEISSYQRMVSEKNQMDAIKEQLSIFAASNSYANTILKYLEGVPKLPAAPVQL